MKVAAMGVLQRYIHREETSYLVQIQVSFEKNQKKNLGKRMKKFQVTGKNSGRSGYWKHNIFFPYEKLLTRYISYANNATTK